MMLAITRFSESTFLLPHHALVLYTLAMNHSEEGTTDINGSRPGHLLAIIGAALHFSPTIIALSFVSAVIKLDKDLAKKEWTLADASVLIDAFKPYIYIWAFFQVIALVGLLLILLAVFKRRYRGEWLFWFMIFYGTYGMIHKESGALLAILLLVIAVTKRKEFMPSLRY